MALAQAKNEEYSRASTILQGVVRSKIARYGSDHESTIQTTGVLAFVLIKDMELEEGLDLLKQVSKWQDKHMKSTHPSVRMTQSALSTVTNLVAGKVSLWV